MKKKSRKRVIAVAIVLVVVVGAWLYLRGTGTEGVGYAQEVAKSQNIATYLSFSGHIRAADSKLQIAKKAMKVSELYVEEGDRVEQDQPLFRTSDGDRIRAEIAGMVETLYAEEDLSLTPGASIAMIVDYDRLKAVVDVDEYDVGALVEGAEIEVYVGALDLTLTGTVSDVAKDATVGSGVSYYETDIDLPTDAQVKAGMSVDAQLLSASAEDATTILMDALRFDDENQPYVYLKDGAGELFEQYVVVGINDGVRVQITSGVQPGDVVYWPDSGVKIVTPYEAMRDSE